jgi:hypothetical protein
MQHAGLAVTVLHAWRVSLLDKRCGCTFKHIVSICIDVQAKTLYIKMDDEIVLLHTLTCVEELEHACVKATVQEWFGAGALGRCSNGNTTCHAWTFDEKESRIRSGSGGSSSESNLTLSSTGSGSYSSSWYANREFVCPRMDACEFNTRKKSSPNAPIVATTIEISLTSGGDFCLTVNGSIQLSTETENKKTKSSLLTIHGAVSVFASFGALFCV